MGRKARRLNLLHELQDASVTLNETRATAERGREASVHCNGSIDAELQPGGTVEVALHHPKAPDAALRAQGSSTAQPNTHQGEPDRRDRGQLAVRREDVTRAAATREHSSWRYGFHRTKYCRRWPDEGEP